MGGIETMKTTTSLYYIIESELKNLGYNQFLHKNQLTFFDKNRNSFTAIIKYENEEVIEASRNTIFFALDFLDSQTRLQFEKEFISMFIYRNIKYQTYELMNAKLVAKVRLHHDLIESLYTHSENFISGKSVTENSGNASSLNRSNTVNINLPQNEVHVSLDKDVFEYADDTRHDKSKQESSSTSSSSATKFDIDTLTKLKEFKHNFFKELDKELFSQIY